MRIGIDFDGTIVRQDDRPYDDVTTPLEFMPGAKHGLMTLKAAGHILLLWSGRVSRALLVDPLLDPLVRAGSRVVSQARWEANLSLNRARVQQMLDFVDAELPGIFDAIDDGAGGKPTVDLFIDDRAVRFGHGPGALSWQQLIYLYGESDEPRDQSERGEEPFGDVPGEQAAGEGIVGGGET